MECFPRLRLTVHLLVRATSVATFFTRLATWGCPPSPSDGPCDCSQLKWWTSFVLAKVATITMRRATSIGLDLHWFIPRLTGPLLVRATSKQAGHHPGKGGDLHTPCDIDWITIPSISVQQWRWPSHAPRFLPAKPQVTRAFLWGASCYIARLRVAAFFYLFMVELNSTVDLLGYYLAW